MLPVAMLIELRTAWSKHPDIRLLSISSRLSQILILKALHAEVQMTFL